MAHFPPTLFLVEDDPEVAWGLAARVEDLGHRVIGVAKIGAEAIELVLLTVERIRAEQTAAPSRHKAVL